MFRSIYPIAGRENYAHSKINFSFRTTMISRAGAGGGVDPCMHGSPSLMLDVQEYMYYTEKLIEEFWVIRVPTDKVHVVTCGQVKKRRNMLKEIIHASYLHRIYVV